MSRKASTATCSNGDCIVEITVRLPQSTITILDNARMRRGDGRHVARNRLINAVVISCPDINAIAREIAKKRSGK